MRHPAAPGAFRPPPSEQPPRALVLGGGIAGIAAAVGLAERGVQVTLIEREAQLGGRVRSWPVDHDDPTPRPDTPVTMSRGFHAFFRQYYNLRALLRRVDPALERLTPVPDYPLVLADGHRDSFAKVPRTPPLNMAAFVAQSPSFRAADLAKLDTKSVWELLDVDFPATFSQHDGESASAFLDRLGFPDGARHLALEVFARSFFARPDEFSAGELVGMFHSYFLGSSEGLLFDVPVDDYDAVFWAPLRDYLERLGVTVRTEETAQRLDLDGEQVAVETDDGTVDRRRDRAGHRPTDHPAADRGVQRAARPGLAEPDRGDGQRTAFRCLAPVAGPARQRRPTAVPGHQRLRPARQRHGAGAVRGRRSTLVRRA